VRRLEQFGAFVELAPGLDGLVHVSRMALDRRVAHPRQVVSVDQEVDVTVVEIDTEKRRIGLSMVESAKQAKDDAEAEERRDNRGPPGQTRRRAGARHLRGPAREEPSPALTVSPRVRWRWRLRGRCAAVGAAELADVGAAPQVAVLARTDLPAAGAARGLAIGDDACPRLGTLVAGAPFGFWNMRTIKSSTPPISRRRGRAPRSACAHVGGHGLRVEAGTVLPLARDLAGEMARVLGDALAEPLRVARDAIRELLGRMACAVAIAAMPAVVPTMRHDGCSS
jgi:predicted RNA-binding protein with RPS1 domain